MYIGTLAPFRFSSFWNDSHSPKRTRVDACTESDPPAVFEMAARLDALEEWDRDTLWAHLAPGWKDYLVHLPHHPLMGALRPLNLTRGDSGTSTTTWGWGERDLIDRRHGIAMALASEQALAAAAGWHGTRRGGRRTRRQKPGGGDYLPGVYLGRVDGESLRPLPPGTTYPLPVHHFTVQLPLCGAVHITSSSLDVTAASTASAKAVEEEYQESDDGYSEGETEAQRWAESGGWGYGGGEEWNDGDGDAGEDVALALADLWVGEG